MESLAFHEGWFTFIGKRNRKSFFLAIISYGCLSFGIFWLFGQFPMTDRTWNLLTILFTIAFSIVGYSITSQRLRDIGLNPWFTLLWIPMSFMAYEYHTAFTLAFYLLLQGVPSANQNIDVH